MGVLFLSRIVLVVHSLFHNSFFVFPPPLSFSSRTFPPTVFGEFLVSILLMPFSAAFATQANQMLVGKPSLEHVSGLIAIKPSGSGAACKPWKRRRKVLLVTREPRPIFSFDHPMVARLAYSYCSMGFGG